MDSFYRSPMMQAINEVFSSRYSVPKMDPFTEQEEFVPPPQESGDLQIVAGAPKKKTVIKPGEGFNQPAFDKLNSKRIEPGMGFNQPALQKNKSSGKGGKK